MNRKITHTNNYVHLMKRTSSSMSAHMTTRNKITCVRQMTSFNVLKSGIKPQGVYR